MMFFYVRALAIILEPTRWLTRFLLSTSKSNDAGSEAARWKGTSCLRHRHNALSARLQNSSVLQLVGDRHGSNLELYEQQRPRVGDQ